MKLSPLAVLFAIAASLLGAACAEADPSRVSFVRSVYEAEIEAFGRQKSAADLTSLLSVRTQDLLKRAKEGPGPNLDGPILHTFFGWRVFPGAKVTLKSVEPGRRLIGSGEVVVTLVVNGEPREIAISVSENCAAGTATVRYCIDDFRYGSQQSYREYLTSLSAP